MYIDTVTVGAFVLILVIFSFVIFINLKKSRSDRAYLRNLEIALEEQEGKLEQREDQLIQRLDEVSKQALIPTEAARHLCCAVRKIYPNAQVGLDFQVADEGEGPFIQHWMMAVPAPSDEQLKHALDMHLKEMEEGKFREQRVASYPSIGDQMDALYKARHGNPHELEALDARIRDIKCMYPKPGDCERDCG